MKQYNTDHEPLRDEWLALDEQERILLVEEYHRRRRIRVPNATLHAVIHVIVENQLALKESVVVETITRLRNEGLNRHDAIHAIGSVLAEQLYSALRGPHVQDQLNEQYRRALQGLSAAKWLAG